MERRKSTISDKDWLRVSRTLDFILSYPVKEEVKVEPKPVEARPLQPALPMEGVIFEAVKV